MNGCENCKRYKSLTKSWANKARYLLEDAKMIKRQLMIARMFIENKSMKGDVDAESTLKEIDRIGLKCKSHRLQT